jgi:hypothetical protein
MSTDKFTALVSDFDLEWTSGDGHNHTPSRLENCYGSNASFAELGSKYEAA